MSSLWIVAILLVFWIGTTTSASCALFRNRLIQVTNQFPGLDPFYSILSLAPGGTFIETTNIADGNNTNTISMDITFNVHHGRFYCPTKFILRLTAVGYIYRSSNVPFLQANGAIDAHQYRLSFLNGQNKQCSGILRFAFYTSGTNPFDPTNKPTLVSPAGNVTCQLLNLSRYSVPIALT